jgi:rSAM/selenodomain-associated transferase 1
MKSQSGREDNTALIVLLKNPKIGHAKTRLAAGIGDQKAFEAYLHLLDVNRQLCEQYDGPIYLYYSQYLPDESARWQMSNGTYKLQSDGDLGNRMQTAFTEVLSNHKRAVIIGSDCPYITLEHLNQVDNLLDEEDVVFGPSLDGGYYLLGLSFVVEQLFEDMPWSTENVLDISLARCESNKLSVALLEPLEDIDELDSWERYIKTDGYKNRLG